MAASKLFTPVLRTKRGSAAESASGGRFLNSPYHATIPRFQGPTDSGEPWYPLSLSGESQTSTKPVEQRGFKSFNGKIDY